MKEGSKCKQTKTPDQFHCDKTKKDGRASYCKNCSSTHYKTWLENLSPKRHKKLNRQKNIHSKTHREKLRKQALAAYGNKCQCCNENTYEFLVIDHINGGGGAHRKELGTSLQVYRWLRKQNYPSGFRVLCHNCNMAFSFYKQCPHETK